MREKSMEKGHAVKQKSEKDQEKTIKRVRDEREGKKK